MREDEVGQIPISEYKNDLDIDGYITTFRITGETTFEEIYNEAIKFWNLNKSKCIITDEYFNDLVLYNDSICSFFHSYEPLNLDNQAF